MKDYEKKVEQHYNSMSSNEIDNGSIDHAKVLVKYLFKMAEEKQLDIKIITGCLESSFYNNFAESAKKILNNNTISIISLEEPEDGAFKDAIKNNSEKGSLVVANEKVKSLPHFIVVGDSAYRFENDDMLKTAKASFNRQSIGSFLNFVFGDAQKVVV